MIAEAIKKAVMSNVSNIASTAFFNLVNSAPTSAITLDRLEGQLAHLVRRDNTLHYYMQITKEIVDDFDDNPDYYRDCDYDEEVARLISYNNEIASNSATLRIIRKQIDEHIDTK